MNLLGTFIILLLTAAPIVLALRYGDRLLDQFARRKRRKRSSARTKKTRALPIRSQELDRLLAAESRLDDLDERIATGLGKFAQLSQPPSPQETEKALDQIEQEVLSRESSFGAYLDFAWMQSETLELLTEEARLLRQLADLPEEGLPVSSESPVAPPPAPTLVPRRRDPSEKLMASLQDALERKSRADQGLRRVGSSSTVPPQSTPPGSRFDATIGDDED